MELQHVRIVFRNGHRTEYQATPETVAKIARDFTSHNDDSKEGGVYTVFFSGLPDEPRTLALQFDDVLHID